MSPFQALYGRPMSMGIDLDSLQHCQSATSAQAYIEDLKSKLQLTHDIVQQNMRDSAQRSKKFYDKNTKTPDINIGFKVL